MSSFREEAKPMSVDNQDFSRIVGEIKREFLHFASIYAKAVNSGANVAGKQIMEAVEELDLPTDILAGKVIEAVKSGVQYAGEQMINSGMDYVEQMKEKAKKQ
jgi:hypothetical protein